MTESSVQMPPPPARFGNFRASLVFAVIALVSLIVVASRHGMIAFAAIALAGYCVYAAGVVMVGVRLRDSWISFPRSPLPIVPFFVVGRATRAVGEIEEITYIGEAFGAQWVTLRFGEDQFPASFASRDERLAFFAAVQARKANVRIYRAY